MQFVWLWPYYTDYDRDFVMRSDGRGARRRIDKTNGLLLLTVLRIGGAQLTP